MTSANLPDDRQWRCQRELLRLRMLLLNQDRTVPSRRVADVRDATNAVIAEAEAMSRTALAAGPHEPEAETFLWVRMTRLASAGDQAVDAARSGDYAALGACLRHFETLTSAIWTVRDAVYGKKRSA